jgi:ribosomal protein S18 acetylase RimI-like enzyme
MTHPLLTEIEAYYDAVPRTATRAEQIGPFTLFVNDGAGWPYYARPSLGATAFTASDVNRVRERQRALGVPESFEWTADVSPALRAAVEAAGLSVAEYPLMALLDEGQPPRLPDGVTLRLVTPDDDLARIGAVAAVAFGVPGTAAGPEGVDALARAELSSEMAGFVRERLRAGRTVTAAAFTAEGPVATGSYQPVGNVSEVAGVGTLPAYRRRGLGAAVTGLLVEDARRRGIQTIFLTAGSEDVARIYHQLGFRRIATGCIASPL